MNSLEPGAQYGTEAGQSVLHIGQAIERGSHWITASSTKESNGRIPHLDIISYSATSTTHLSALTSPARHCVTPTGRPTDTPRSPKNLSHPDEPLKGKRSARRVARYLSTRPTLPLAHWPSHTRATRRCKPSRSFCCLCMTRHVDHLSAPVCRISLVRAI